MASWRPAVAIGRPPKTIPRKLRFRSALIKVAEADMEFDIARLGSLFVPMTCGDEVALLLQVSPNTCIASVLVASVRCLTEQVSAPSISPLFLRE